MQHLARAAHAVADGDGALVHAAGLALPLMPSLRRHLLMESM